MIIKDSQMKNVTSHPLYGSLKGISVKSLNPDEFLTTEAFPEQTRIHEISWVEMPSGTAIPEHKHEGCEDVKVIIYGMGMYREEGFQEKVDAGDVIITQKGLTHSLENVGHYPLVYISITIS